MDKSDLVVRLVLSIVIGFLFATGYHRGKGASLGEYLESALSVAGVGGVISLIFYFLG